MGHDVEEKDVDSRNDACKGARTVVVASAHVGMDFIKYDVLVEGHVTHGVGQLCVKCYRSRTWITLCDYKRSISVLHRNNTMF